LSRAQKKSVKEFVSAFNLDARYWPELELPFRRFMLDLPGDGDAALGAWRNVVSRLARSVFRYVERASDQSPRMFKAIYGPSGGYAVLGKGLRKLHSQEQEKEQPL
jgi:hypothetical protein